MQDLLYQYLQWYQVFYFHDNDKIYQIIDDTRYWNKSKHKDKIKALDGKNNSLGNINVELVPVVLEIQIKAIPLKTIGNTYLLVPANWFTSSSISIT
jgi:hypothetical protein